MASYNEIRRVTNIMAKEVSEITGVKVDLVHNVIQYARRLCHPSRPDVIEELVFIGQMGRRFGITSILHVKLMFDAVKVRDTRLVTLEDYVKLICIFYSKNLDVKIDFVYNVYDQNHDNQLSTSEMRTLLQNAIVSTDYEDAADQLKEIIDIVLGVFDTDGDGQISVEEYRRLVHQNILYIQLLGQVLPHKAVIDAFMDDLSSKTPLAVRDKFAHERTDCLYEPRVTEVKNRLYPVTLDLP